MLSMRTIAALTLGLVALAAPGRSGEIYQWTDSAGRLHYSNMPAARQTPTRSGSDAVRAQGPSRAAPSESAGAGGGSPSDDAFSTDASLRRNALERDLRATETRLRELDARLAALARARTRNAGGSAATGGVAAPALQVRSDEERALAAEREQFAAHAAEVRGDCAKLREEVTARLGATPAWWIDVR